MTNMARYRSDPVYRRQVLDAQTARRSTPEGAQRNRDITRQWRQANPEHAKAYARAYRQANKGRLRYRADKHGPYGLEDFGRFWELQQGRCYLCEESLGDDVQMDHDHKCCPLGQSCRVCRRGLVHNGCNALIGHAGDDPGKLELIARNLRRVLTT